MLKTIRKIKREVDEKEGFSCGRHACVSHYQCRNISIGCFCLECQAALSGAGQGEALGVLETYVRNSAAIVSTLREDWRSSRHLPIVLRMRAIGAGLHQLEGGAVAGVEELSVLREIAGRPVLGGNEAGDIVGAVGWLLRELEADEASRLEDVVDAERSTVKVSEVLSLVVIDPEIECGQPTVRGTRIRVGVLAESFSAGVSIAQLAREFFLAEDVVSKAIEWYRTHAPKASIGKSGWLARDGWHAAIWKTSREAVAAPSGTMAGVAKLSRDERSAETGDRWDPDTEARRVLSMAARAAVSEAIGRAADGFVGPEGVLAGRGRVIAQAYGDRLAELVPTPEENAHLRRVRSIIQSLHQREPGRWGDSLESCILALDKVIGDRRVRPPARGVP